MIQNLKKRFKASKASLEEMISAINIASLEADAVSNLSVELLDMNDPVVNGIHLYEHPYRGVVYRQINAKKAKIAVLKKEGKVISILTARVDGTLAFDLSDFNYAITSFKSNVVLAKVSYIIKGNFTVRHGRPNMPKDMKPEDFWCQFTDKENSIITASMDEDVVAFVSKINKMNKVNPKNNPVRDGVTLLYSRGLISNRTLSSITDDAN